MRSLSGVVALACVCVSVPAAAQSVADTLVSLTNRVTRLESQPATASVPGTPAAAAATSRDHVEVIDAAGKQAGWFGTSRAGTVMQLNDAGSYRMRLGVSSTGGYLEALNASGKQAYWLGSSTNARGLFDLNDEAGNRRIRMSVETAGPVVSALNRAGKEVFWLGTSTTSNGLLTVGDAAGNEGARIEIGEGGGSIQARNTQNQRSGWLGTNKAGDGALYLYNRLGRAVVTLDTGGDDGDKGGWATFLNESGKQVVYVGINQAGTGKITVNGKDVGDYAEWFAADAAPTPGTVMCATDTGRTRPCDTSYARTVVGVVSGAGALDAGLILGEESDTGARIAMSGQVYVRCVLTNGSVHVGDLLVAAGPGGTAMPVSDAAAPPAGTVVGKALETRQGAAGSTTLVRMLVLNR